MEKRITQETFDEVVKENVEEFDMSLADAIKDAVNQFARQGVTNLDSIDTSGGIGRDEFLEWIGEVAQIANDPGSKVSVEALIDSVKALSQGCHDKNEFSKRNQHILVSQGGLVSIYKILRKSSDHVIVCSLFELMINFSKGKEEYRDFFEPGGSEILCNALKGGEGTIFFKTGMELARVVAKSENNKTLLMRHGLGAIIAQHVVTAASEELELSPAKQAELRECCLALRGLCIHDDLRKEMSCAHENGRFFLAAQGLVPALMTLSSKFLQYPSVASSALSAAKALVTTEEAVKVMAQHGAMTLGLAILSRPEAEVALVRSLLGLVRNLCADDIRKNRLVSDGTLNLIVKTLTDDKYVIDAPLVENGVACIAAMTLRSPSNSQKIVELGTMPVLIRCMGRHGDKAALQRQGCLAMRNIAARCPELRNGLLDAGCENALRHAGTMRESVDEAYAALRDLGCEVQFVRVSEDGKVEAAFEMFGSAANKPKFNPVFEETSDILHRMNEESRAPFAAEGGGAGTDHRLSHLDDDDDDEADGGDNRVPFVNAGGNEHEHGHDHGHGHKHGHGHDNGHAEHEHGDGHEHHGGSCCASDQPSHGPISSCDDTNHDHGHKHEPKHDHQHEGDCAHHHSSHDHGHDHAHGVTNGDEPAGP